MRGEGWKNWDTMGGKKKKKDLGPRARKGLARTVGCIGGNLFSSAWA